MRYAHCTLQSASRNARQKAYCAPPTTLARCEVLPQLAEMLTSAGKREQLCDLIQAYCAPASHMSRQALPLRRFAGAPPLWRWWTAAADET